MGTYSDLIKAGRHNTQQQPKQVSKTRQKNPATKPPSRNCDIVTNITLLQSDIDDLREPTNDARTIRLRDNDIEIVKDTAYMLRKNVKKHVSQSDVTRLAIRILQKLAASNNAGLAEVIGLIK